MLAYGGGKDYIRKNIYSDKRSKHMRQVVVWMSLAGSAFILALTINLFDGLFMFLLFGILPGRVEPLSADQMLAIYGMATASVCVYALRSTLQSLVRLAPQRQTRRSAS
jgi:hypothetical protein